MIDARWNNIIDFDTFSDLDRTMIGNTDYRETDVNEEIEYGKEQVEAWMQVYKKNRWENQSYYPEIFIEKKALQGVFSPVCEKWNITLGACKGYPSLTFLYDAYLRFKRAERIGKIAVVLYFGDYDPSGEDIPRSISENLKRFGINIEVRRIALMEHQVIEWKLPPAPAKDSDTRSRSWNGLGQVELDAVNPRRLMELCDNAISEIFDNDLCEELLEVEETEKFLYRKELKEFVNNL